MRLDFNGTALLLDIEGTTSSVRFVYDQMFPFVRREIERFLTDHLGDQNVVAACDQIVREARETGSKDFEDWPDGLFREQQIKKMIAEVTRLMDGDVKATGLKELQGLIWKSGFESGQLCAHVYEDVPPALKKWHRLGMDIRIYSSGSVSAQKLFFAHTEAGDLLSFLRGHYDTKIGGKKEAESYRKIAEAFDLTVGEILFLSDVVEELDAAREAGLKTGLSLRPENSAIADNNGHPTITSFRDIKIGSNKSAETEGGLET